MNITYTTLTKSHCRRILHVVPSLTLGGTEKTAQLLATNSNKELYITAVWSPSSGPREKFFEDANIPVWTKTSLDTTLYRFKPHIVHIHRAGWPEPERMRAFRGTEWFYKGIKLPKIIETNVFGRYDPSFSGQLIDKTLFVSKFCASRFSNATKFKVPSIRYDTLYNPVEVNFITTHTTSPDKKNFSIPIIGRLSRADKGKWSIPFGLNIIPELIYRIPTLKYLIVGGIQEAYDFVTINDLTQHVYFLPEITTELELSNYLDKLSIFTHANDTGESFGLVIAEAMAAGLPVVTHSCSNLKDNAQTELVEHGITGFIADTPQQYIESIVTLIKNPNIAKHMGKAGQKKARQLFNISVIIEQLERIYDELCPPEFACPLF